jgi:hypothetical protein
MLCEEKDRLLTAYVVATDLQAEAVSALAETRGEGAAYIEAMSHAEQARNEAEKARWALHHHSEMHGC